MGKRTPLSATAVVLRGRRDLRVEALELPYPAPGEIRVALGAALTCGTDLKVWRRGGHARMITAPSPFGHEMAGTVEAVGEGVETLRPGDRVVIANSAPCGECHACLRGREELCADLLFVNGAYAEAMLVPARVVARNTLTVPDGLPLEAAAMTEPLACVVHGLKATPVRPGETVAVIGCGPIGLFFVALAARSGATVIAAGRRASRLALARQLGAAQVIDTAEAGDVAVRLRDLTERSEGPDLVVEAVGSPEAWEAAVAAVRSGGRVNLFGGCAAGVRVPLDAHRLHYDELSLHGSFHHTPDSFRQALGYLAAGDVPYRPFLSGAVALHEVPALFESLDNGLDVVKMLVHTQRA